MHANESREYLQSLSPMGEISETPNFNTALIESLNSVERPQSRRARQGCVTPSCLNRKPGKNAILR